MCIAFLAADAEKVLAGDNEDYVYPKTRVWFIPQQGGVVDAVPFAGGKYARAYFGYDKYPPQSGLNQGGLCFAVTSAPYQKLESAAAKPEYDGYLVDKIMAECETVEQAAAMAAGYAFKDREAACLFLGDKSGNSAIIDGDAVLRKNGRYQVLTNYRQAQVKPGAYPCDRYNIAAGMLEENNKISIDLFRRILAATHQENSAQTVYSVIFDLQAGAIYLYHFHNYTNVKVFDPAEHWSKEAHAYALPSLFPKTYAAMVYDRVYDLQTRRESIAAERRAAGEFIEVAPEVLARYPGRYHIGTYGEKTITISLEGNRLFAQVTGRDKEEMYPRSPVCFVLMQPAGDQVLTFDPAEDPAVNIAIDGGNGYYTGAARIE